MNNQLVYTGSKKIAQHTSTISSGKKTV